MRKTIHAFRGKVEKMLFKANIIEVCSTVLLNIQRFSTFGDVGSQRKSFFVLGVCWDLV